MPARSRTSDVPTTGGGHVNGGVLASFVPGPQGQAAINRYLDTYRNTAALAIAPTSLINFGEAVNFPLIFGAMLAVFGAATLLHLLVVSVSRRRREFGILKVVGFVNGQVVSAVAWQATTLALIGIVIGVPWVWWPARRCGRPLQTIWVRSRSLSFRYGSSECWCWGVVVANLIAIGPALIATRSKPADLLRTT